MISNRSRVVAMAVVITFLAIGCFGPAAPAPTPTPTLDIRSMVESAVAKAFAPTLTPTPDIQSAVQAAVNATLAAAATPAPTYTPRPTPTPRSIYAPVPTIPPTPIRITVPPTPRITTALSVPTPESRRLQEVDCEPKCYSDYEPILPPVDWISPPKISENGVIELVAVLDDGIDMGPIGMAGGGHFTVTDDEDILYGTIVAPTPPGWHWDPQPGLWVAQRFDYVASTLRVRVQVSPAAVTHQGLRLCLWSGGIEGERDLLDCVQVKQP